MPDAAKQKRLRLLTADQLDVKATKAKHKLQRYFLALFAYFALAVVCWDRFGLGGVVIPFLVFVMIDMTREPEPK